MGGFQDPKGFRIGEFKGPNTDPIEDLQGPTYSNVEFEGVHPTIAQIVGGFTQGLGVNDKWMKG